VRGSPLTVSHLTVQWPDAVPSGPRGSPGRPHETVSSSPVGRL